uniref:Uncharacterized protein n=1 Tax=Helianthus annuus TaxID=4232 RepID=A0A251UKU7_HELAN
MLKKKKKITLGCRTVDGNFRWGKTVIFKKSMLIGVINYAWKKNSKKWIANFLFC